ncbi:protein ABHD11-like [Diaphorina citri]|uniref:sn-1-specific diacylglycerol lipase ABHD11 n=1 Tax=Diaphorina citri TaxID=121845 RepID=A0A1S3CZK8_DIACI|nr:protein ABHD11-like [Diaphorina citri]
MIPLIQVGLFRNCLKCKLIISSRLCQQLSQQNDRITPIKMSFKVADTETPVDPDTKPIIIMHGLLGSKNNWNSLAKAIHRKTKKKIARNHGDSPHTDVFSYAHLAEDVKYFLETESIAQADVLGHSMGGRAMMYLALANPHLVSSLIVVDISPVGVSPTLRHMSGLFDAMKSVNLDELSGQPLHAVRKIVDKALATAVDDMGVRQFILTNLKLKGKQIIWQCNLDSLQTQFFNHMINFPQPGEKTYGGPTLFIGGGRSDFIRQEDHPGIKSLFPRAEITYIEDAGHWVHSQKPDLFVDKVVDFYRSLS